MDDGLPSVSKGFAVPLGKFQSEVLRTLAPQRSPDSYIAGGVAILGVAAKLERRRILERTARGRADAKANGVKFGRKPILTPHQQKEALKRLEAGETQRSVARSYNVSQSAISRL
jgi:DNA invertase Pin-like site-specific DNA recombinase